MLSIDILILAPFSKLKHGESKIGTINVIVVPLEESLHPDVRRVLTNELLDHKTIL